MGNLLACSHSSSSEAPDADLHSPGPEELLGFGDVSQLILNRSCSEEAKNPAPNPYSEGLGLTHKSEEPELQQAPPSTGQKFLNLFKKDKKEKKAKKKNNADGGSSSTPVTPVKAPAAKYVKPVIDDRSKFGLSPLPTLTLDKSRYLSSLCVSALLGELGAACGIKSVKRQALEKAAREADLLLQAEQKAEQDLLDQAKQAAPVAAPVSASATPIAAPAAVQAIDASIIVGESAPAAPPMTLNSSFAPVSAAVAAEKEKAKPKSNELWKKGTGYGHYGCESNWTMESYMASLKVKQQQMQFICRVLSERLTGKNAERVSAEALAQTTLLPFLETYLRNDSMNEMLEQHSALYSDIFHLVAHLIAAGAPSFSPYLELVQGKIAGYIQKIAKSAEMVEKMEGADAPAASASASSSSTPAPVFTITSFVIELNRTLEANLAGKAQQDAAKKAAVEVVAEVVATPASSSSSSSVAVAEPSTEREDSVSTNSSSSSSSVSVEEKEVSDAAVKVESDKPSAELLAEYKKALEVHRFGEVEEFDYHKYQKRDESSGSKAAAAVNRAFTRRLAVEFADLNESLPIHYESSVWMRVHESKMQYAQMMISGPSGTPYESGLFLFDVFFGSQYPNSPPEVNLQTTGNGTTRFNPNLYNSGKVCLSLLGTWSGGSGEGWSANNSTMLQVGVSIQSLIFVEQPYFNEPGYESSINTPEGQKQSDAYSTPLMKATVMYAMMNHMEKPPKGFEGVVSAHFALKKEAILKQMEAWKVKNPEIEALIPQLKAALEKQKVA